MSETTSKYKDFLRTVSRKMPAFTAEAVSEEIREHVGTVVSLGPSESRKAALQFAATVIKLPFSRVKCLYYGEARRIEAHEADQIRAYVYAAGKLIQAKADYEKSRREFIENASPAVARLAPPEVVDADSAIAEAERVIGHSGGGGR